MVSPRKDTAGDGWVVVFKLNKSKKCQGRETKSVGQFESWHSPDYDIHQYVGAEDLNLTTAETTSPDATRHEAYRRAPLFVPAMNGASPKGHKTSGLTILSGSFCSDAPAGDASHSMSSSSQSTTPGTTPGHSASQSASSVFGEQNMGTRLSMADLIRQRFSNIDIPSKTDDPDSDYAKRAIECFMQAK